MKILIAPDSFKGGMSSATVAQVIADAAVAAMPRARCVLLPVADGGEGMVNALFRAVGKAKLTAKATGPLGAPLDAEYALLKDGSVVIEMAAASGISLVPVGERDIMAATTYGTGQIIAHALDAGYRRFVLGLGGSATNDGGMGAAEALGMRFLDADGNALKGCGGNLAKVCRVDLSKMHEGLAEAEFTIACDVKNPLCGELGASAIYGPQKGASPEQVRELDAGLRHYGSLLEDITGRRIVDIPGMGAAGGMAVPFMAFLKAEMKSGLDIVLDTQGFDELVKDANLVITGEGRTDEQSAMGKVPQGVGLRAKAAGVPAIVISGSVEEGAKGLRDSGITAMFATCATVQPLEWHLQHSRGSLYNAAYEIFSLLNAVIK